MTIDCISAVRVKIFEVIKKITKDLTCLGFGFGLIMLYMLHVVKHEV